MLNNKDQQFDRAGGENIKIPEKEIPIQEQVQRLEREKIETPETREARREEEIVSAELRREIEMMELDEKAKAEAEKAREKIEFLGEKEKIEHLLKIAKKKGLVFAVQVARRMNEPYLLDVLHDALAREGYYKDFAK